MTISLLTAYHNSCYVFCITTVVIFYDALKASVLHDSTTLVGLDGIRALGNGHLHWQLVA